MESAQRNHHQELVLTSVAGIDARMEIAGVGARAYAFIIDWHIRILVALLWFVVAAFVFAGSLDITGIADDRFAVNAMVWPPVAIYFLYHPLFELITRGSTPGKRYAGVRIVTAEGAVPGVGPILIRNLLRIIDTLPTFYMLGMVTAIIDERARRVGDMAAGTLLVRVEDAAADTFERLSERRDTALPPRLAEVTTELLDRWEDLAPPRREALGHKILVQAGAADVPSAELRGALQVLLENRP